MEEENYSRDLLAPKNSKKFPQDIEIGPTDSSLQAEVESAAKEANIYNFIMSLPNKYETKVGER